MSEITREQVLELRDWVMRQTVAQDRRETMRTLVSVWEREQERNTLVVPQTPATGINAVIGAMPDLEANDADQS